MIEEPKNQRTETRAVSCLQFFSSLVLCFSPPASSDDVVIAASATNPASKVKRSGQILDYTGVELKLRTSLGPVETIPASRVIEVQTTWIPPHEAARTARAEGRLDDALAIFRQAKREESRPWAARQIMADLVGCYLDAGRIDSAGDEFLTLIASDPVTRHFDVIPIAWRGMALESAAEARAAAWLAARAPVAKLLGASWLLATTRSAAQTVLEEQAKSTDPRIAGLAAIQLWRTKLVTATTDDVRRWQMQLEKMPPEIQPAGWYVLGDCLARLNEPQAASIAYLKTPLLFRQQRVLSAEALLAAGTQLEKMGRSKEAAALYREVARDFPGLAAASETQTRLTKP